MDEQIESNGNMTTIKLDGSIGEGGGQILRTALSLSMITGTPFEKKNIRANRPKPGLLRQHLTAVLAAQKVCGAYVTGAEMGSPSLTFRPGAVKGGTYAFAIGSAGSATLVLQTILPALLFADAESHISIDGGTHNSMAPPAHFLKRAFVPLLNRMGANVSVTLERFGFYPAGGGRITAHVVPCKQLTPLTLTTRGARTGNFAEAFIAGVPGHVGRRELDVIGAAMGWDETQLLMRGLADTHGPGNVVLITLAHENVTEVFSAFGEKGIAAEAVANKVLTETREYIASTAAVGEHLADQLLIPLALAGAGMFTTTTLSDHTITNMNVIKQFLPVEFATAARAARCVEIGVLP
jgi:RNA 3'-terminal phosphate cyclase (ATP)